MKSIELERLKADGKVGDEDTVVCIVHTIVDPPDYGDTQCDEGVSQ